MIVCDNRHANFNAFITDIDLWIPGRARKELRFSASAFLQNEYRLLNNPGVLVHFTSRKASGLLGNAITDPYLAAQR